MKFITESQEQQTIEDMVESVVIGSIDKEQVHKELFDYAEQHELGAYSHKSIVESVNLTVQVLEAMADGLCDLDSVDSFLEAFADEYGLDEATVKRVSVASKRSGGKLVTKVKDRKTRARKAASTTGLSKSSLRKRARKAAKTKRRTGGSQKKKSQRLRAKSMKKRKQMGL
ncbi:head scaffolding protein [Vibrio phage D479]